MKITRKQLTPVISIVAVIAAFALLFATYSPLRSELGTNESFSLSDPAGTDFTEQIVDEDVKVFSSQGKSMYVSYGGIITVKDDESDTILWTNSAKDNDVLIFGESEASSSPVHVTYRYNGETDTNLYSGADAVDNNQYTVSLNEDGSRLQVTYLMGEAGEGLLPQALTKQFMEKEIFSNLDDEKKDYLLERYVLYKKGTADSNLISEYPGMAEEDIYYLASPGSYVIQTKIISYFVEAGFTSAQYKEQCEITGEQAVIYNENFMLTIEYWLDNGDVMINIPGDRVYYHSEHPLTTITLNGAATYAENTQTGEYLLPAGSGALQSFAVNGERNNNYTYYGTDYLNTVSTAKETDFPLPVYGVVRQDQHGLLGIIESGAEMAVLNERFTNGASQLNLSLRLLDYGDASVTAQQTSTVYCNSQFKDNFTVRYCMTEVGSDAINMASKYRELLISQDKMPEKTEKSQSSLIEIVSNVPYSYQWFGLFKVNKQITLTNWDEAQEIAETLVSSGINSSIKLSGFNTKGLYCQTPGKYKFIGSAKERNILFDYMDSNSIDTYLDVSLAYNYTRASELFDGYSAGKHSARVAGNDNAQRPVESKSTGVSAQKASDVQIVSPKMYETYANSYSKIDKRIGISLGDAFDSLNTDYSEKTPYNRTDTLKALQTASGILAKDRNIMGQNPIMPMLNTITLSENLTITGEAKYAFSSYVPFVQAVLHGSVMYTSDSLNSYNDYKLALLEAVATGSNLKYTVSYSFDRDVMSTEYDFLYYTDWTNWKETITKDISDVQKLYDKIYNAQIIDYENTGNMSVTKYSNNVTVYVNYTDKDITINDVTIPAISYKAV